MDFGTDLESLTHESYSSKITKEKPKRKFRDAWRDKFPWIRCIMQGEKTLMKCTWCYILEMLHYARRVASHCVCYILAMWWLWA